MIADPARCRITTEHLVELATGPGRPATVRLLRHAQLSKHLLLLAAVDAVARREHPGAHAEARFDEAYELLAEVHADRPAVVEAVLALPQVGVWALRCLERMGRLPPAGRTDRRPAPEPWADRPLWADLGYVNGLAASAALSAGRPVDLVVPVPAGRVVLPGLGAGLPVAGSGPIGSRVRLRSRGWPPGVGVPAVTVTPVDRDDPLDLAWSPLPELRSGSRGMRLAVRLDDQDPYLDCFGHPVASRTSDGTGRSDGFAAQLDQAWRLLTRWHRGSAAAIAAGLRTVVPLAPATGHRVTATCCLAHGAVGIGPHGDPLGLAESLVHEFQHVKLGAVADLVTLVRPGAGGLAYAPWRPDPRPYAALLQGAYAFAGVAAFWRDQRWIGPAPAALRAHVEYARWRAAAELVTATLLASPWLTEQGRAFVGAVRAVLRGWRDDAVPAPAGWLARDVLDHHSFGWRLRHIQVPAPARDRLLRAWAGGLPPPAGAIGHVVPGRAADPVVVRRGRLLELRYRDPPRAGRLLAGDLDPTVVPADPAGVALVREDDAAAEACLRERLARCPGDRAAWAGLALVVARRARRHGRHGRDGRHGRHREAAPAAGDIGAAAAPETARALQLSLLARGGGEDPVELLRWSAARPVGVVGAGRAVRVRAGGVP